MIRTGTELDLNRATRLRIRDLGLRQYEELKLRAYIKKGHIIGKVNGVRIYNLNFTNVTIDTWLANYRGETI